LPRARARDRRRRRAREVDHAVRDAAGERVAAVRSRRDESNGPGGAGLHERHDRSAHGGADAAAVPARQPAGIHAFARRLSAARRPLLVAGRLGVDRRPDGRAAAGAVLRPADRRLPRPVRPRARSH
jgi:hypothetical protein